jgi:segregation and condensation protein B
MSNKVSKTDIIEAILFAAEAPMSIEKIAHILELNEEQAMAELEMLREEKSHIGGLQIIEVSGGWQMLTKPEMAPYVFKLREAPRQKLSRAAFEVLAVTAYRQPLTRAEIEELRGVDCSRPLMFLMDKKLVQFAGRKDSPGRPWLYETTQQFLDHFGLRSIDDLPPLAELAELAEEGGARALFTKGPMQELQKTVAQLDDEENTEEEASESEDAQTQAATGQEPASDDATPDMETEVTFDSAEAGEAGEVIEDTEEEEAEAAEPQETVA